MDNRLEKEWVKDWDIDTIIGMAVSYGMQYQVEKMSTEDLKHNKQILIDEINKRICYPKKK